MRVFITGATGFVGAPVVKDLLSEGHQVLGLARSDASADWLEAAGAQVHRGDLEDLDSLTRGANKSDGVIHLGFVHDFSRFKEVCEIDRVAIETLGKSLAGSNRPLVVTSGTALLSPGRLATEDDAAPSSSEIPRVSESAAFAFANQGVKVSAVRLSPSVHGDGDKGFIPILINTAREKGVSAYIGDGLNRWTAVHRLDSAPLYRLVLENAPGGLSYHGVAEEGIAVKDIAELIGRKLSIPVVSIPPVEAPGHFGWFAGFAAIDAPASSKLTQERLNWHPVQTTLLNDMEHGTYFQA